MFNGKFVPLHPLSRHQSTGEMVEWSITVVLKTTVPRGTGGSNPSLSAKQKRNRLVNKRLRFPFIGLHPFLHPLYALVREKSDDFFGYVTKFRCLMSQSQKSQSNKIKSATSCWEIADAERLTIFFFRLRMGRGPYMT